MARDAINAIYTKADIEGDGAMKGFALRMLAHLAKERRAAGLPEIRIPFSGGRA